MPTYENSPTWTVYRDILESEAGLTFDLLPTESTVEIRGHQVHLDEWTPSGEPRGTVILVHGGGGNGRILAPFALHLCRGGWRVLAPDLPGYGLTSWAEGVRPDYREWPLIVAELADAQSDTRGLVGFSVGGMTAVFASELATRSVPTVATTLVDMGNAAIFRRAARWRVVGSLSLLGFRIMPSVVDALNLPLTLVAPLRKMSRSKVVKTYFLSDALLGRLRVPVRFFRTLHDYRIPNPRYDFPVLLAHPGEDEWTPAEWSVEWLKGSEIEDSTVVISRTGSHLPLEPESFDTILRSTHEFLLAHAEQHSDEVAN